MSSIAPPSESNPHPLQHVFSSAADESSFEIYPDPRGNTLVRGTEITLVLKDDALEFLDSQRLHDLVYVLCFCVKTFCGAKDKDGNRNKHSGFSTSFPIYLWHTYEDIVPVEDTSLRNDSDDETDVDEAVVEDVLDDEVKESETKKITVEEWMHINPMPPVWMR